MNDKAEFDVKSLLTSVTHSLNFTRTNNNKRRYMINRGISALKKLIMC